MISADGAGAYGAPQQPEIPLDDYLQDYEPVERAEKPHPRFDITSVFWRHIAAGSAGTPPAVLAVLAADKSPRVRKKVASNPNAYAETLSLLASDSVESVRMAVARNPHTPVEVYKKLSQDESVDVRFAIAANQLVPDAILLSLFLDPDACVADRASQTLAA